jgi:sRNA-binding carbon storage regulator CsrA
MLTFTCEDGQTVQIGDITVTVLEVGDGEVLLRIDSPEGLPVEISNADIASQWRLD